MSSRWMALGMLCALAAGARGQTFISEVLFDGPSTDQGQESVEIQTTPGFAFTGWWLLTFDGDSTESGKIDLALDLSSYSAGANGLLLIRDTSTVLQPAPDVNTNVAVFDFNPDLENGTNTYVIGFGGTFSPGQDFDTNNDGTFDVPLTGFTPADAVSYTDSGTSDSEYGDDLGGTKLGHPSTGTIMALYRIRCGSSPLLWAGGTITGATPGPYNFVSGQHFGWSTIGESTPPTLNLGNFNYSIVDCDGDCVSDLTESDRDHDGTIDDCDGCPDDGGKIAPGECGCGVADIDSDGDLILDCFDNCDFNANNDQQNSDGDSYGDVCDNCPFVTNENQANTDGDGAGDVCDECFEDFNKVDPGQCGCGVPDTDTDGDGTADCIDGCPEDPNKIEPGVCGCGVPDTDTDGDGTADCNDGCPEDPNKIEPGVCGCGTPDTDTDGDGTADCNDGCPEDPNKTEPGVCGCGTPDTDTDGDGTADCNDGCPEDPNKIEPGVCGCGTPDTDTDGDGTADCNDGCPEDPNKVEPGVCGCGTPDTDTDGDGTADCIDGCPEDPNKIEPGVCGCGTPDTDTDGDGVADCEDNCPDVFNPGQEDGDGDGVGDACEEHGDCTGLEYLQMRCKLNSDNTITVISKLFNGIPGQPATFRLDSDPNTDVTRTININGKAKAKYFGIPNGQHFVAMLECGVEASLTCGPQP